MSLGAKFLLFGLCLMLGRGQAFAADAVDYEDVVAERRDGVYYASLSLQASVPPALALEVLTDFDHMAEFVPNLTASRIVSHSGNVYRIAQQGRASFGPLGFRFDSERQVEVQADGRLLSKALSGSPKYLRSELRVQAVGAGSRLDYRIEVIPELWAPAVLGVSFMRHELAEQFTALVREMERRQKARQAR
ncbi:MAG TPA: SRPBCC family protein [Azonexus sp.]|nr:SRPBCC family protein [Azonexus sp.]